MKKKDQYKVKTLYSRWMICEVGQEIEVEIRDVGTRGEGIGQVDGLTVFVPGALPLEVVKARVTVRKKSYALCKLEKILKTSLHRNESPPCPYFPKCGGCQIMHLQYDAQIDLKRRRVVDALKRIGGFDHAEEITSKTHPSEKIYHYRNKMQLPTLGQSLSDRKIGLFQRDSHDLVDIETCLIQSAVGDAVYGKIRKLLLSSQIAFYNEEKREGELRYLLLRTNESRQETLVCLVSAKPLSKNLEKLAEQIYELEGVLGVVYGKNAKASNAIYPSDIKTLKGEGKIVQNVLGFDVWLSPFSFFQVNTESALQLYQKAYELAFPEKGESVLDAYCGIGTFALYLAKQGCKVHGVELVASAIEDARENAKRNGLEATFTEGRVEDYLAKCVALSSLSTIFLNPPRKGCEKSVLDEIGNARIPKVVYTSCDPATLARDTKLLSEYGYKLKQVEVFDLFPQTVHVETIALITK